MKPELKELIKLTVDHYNTIALEQGTNSYESDRIRQALNNNGVSNVVFCDDPVSLYDGCIFSYKITDESKQWLSVHALGDLSNEGKL